MAKVEVFNITNKAYDLGALVYHDSSSFENLTKEQTFEKTKVNANKFYQALFSFRKTQPDRGVLEFDTPYYSISLPKIEERLPRLVPPAKVKPETRWEQFRKEKGMAPRQRRDRKVFDPVTKRWLRRFGHNSIKKIQEKRTAIIEVKPGQDYVDPFEKMDVEKKLMLEKEKGRAIKNQMRAAGINMKLLREKKSLYDTERPDNKKKREKKGLRKDQEILENTLKNAQISTASMGVYDRKAAKSEKAVKRKKKLNVFLSSAEEKDRSLKVLRILKSKESMVNDDVMIRKR
jgi:hypothetical protein